MTGDCCTSVLYGPAGTVIQDLNMGLTWVELRLELLTP